MNNIISKLSNSILVFLIFILPLSFSSLFFSTFDTTKMIVLVIAALLFLLFIAFEMFSEKRLALKFSSFDLALLLFVMAFVTSSIFKSPNLMDAFLLPGTTTVLISAFLTYLFTKKVFDSHKEKLAHVLVFSSLTVALTSILSYLGVFEKIPQLPQFVKEISFSLVGGKLPESIFLASILPLTVFFTFQEKEMTKKVFYALSAFITVLAITLSVSLMLPGKPTSPIIVGSETSWAVAIDTIKSSPFFGAGPGNYLSAFSQYLPISHNATEIWAIRFSSAGSFFFTLVTEAGILGVASFAALVILIIKNVLFNFKKTFKESNLLGAFATVSIFISTICLFIFPANIVLITLFLILLIFRSHNKDYEIKTLPIFGIIPLILVAAVLFVSVRGISAERQYKIATDAIIRNDGRTAYDNLRGAINTNPYVDRYHSAYAQINLALARGLAQKTELTDEEKDTIAQLIQQAIKEGKAAVSLNPQKSGNWELLGRVYQSIMPFAEGADDFAVQTFNQAIALDPLNPNLRISLGGIYYALGKYDDAIKSFEMAVVAKSDLANAHYNLSAAYREKKDVERAISEMKTVLTLVEQGSQDYILAQNELSSLEKNSESTIPNGTENLSLPDSQINQGNNLEGIELTNEENPPLP